MAKNIIAAVVGYVIVFVLVFGLMTGCWALLGADGAFEPNVWDATPIWLLLMLLSAVLAAIAGGYATAKLGRDSRAIWILVGIIVVLGVVFALPTLSGDAVPPLGPRPDVLPMLEAMQNGRQPAWIAFLNPMLGVVGVLLGRRIASGPSVR